MTHSLPTLEVRILPVADLIPAPYNPRKRLGPGDSAYDKLLRGIREFGLVEPLIWNESSGRLVGGHLRLRILKHLGIVEVPVSVVRLSEAREKALNLLLNNQEAQGRFDTEKLADLLCELADLPELGLSGFDTSTLADLSFEPEPLVDATEASSEKRLEITLIVPFDLEEAVRSRLDPLITEFDLVSHSKRR